MSVGLGLAQGGAAIAKHEQGRELRDLQMSQAKTMQKQAEANFAESQAMAPVRKQGAELELQQLRNQVDQQNRQNVQTTMYDGFRRFDADKNPEHLNVALKNAKSNPLGQKLHGNTMRVDKLVRSPANDKLLAQYGIPNPADAYDDNLPNLVVATKADGSQTIADVNELMVGTGYTKYMTDMERDARMKEAQITNMLRQGQSPAKTDKIQKVIESLMASNPDMTYAEAYEQVQSMGKAGASLSGDQAGIKSIMDENPDLPYLDAAQQWFDLKNKGQGQSDRDTFIQDYMAENEGATRMDAQKAYDTRVPTSTQKEVVSVEAVKDNLDEMNFLEKPWDELTKTEQNKAGRYVNQIEDLRKLKFTTEEHRVMRDFKNLTDLAGTVTDELSEEQTGLLDNMFSSAKKYFINEVGGTNASSAYHTFRNNMRKTLSGQSLTAQEIKAFDKAAGSLGQQLVPALSAFRTQVKTIKSQLESIRDQKDPYLAQFYLGQDIGEVDDTIRRLDARIDDINSIGPKSGFQSSEDIQKDLGQRIKNQKPGVNTATGEVDFDALFEEVQGGK